MSTSEPQLRRSVQDKKCNANAVGTRLSPEETDLQLFRLVLRGNGHRCTHICYMRVFEGFFSTDYQPKIKIMDDAMKANEVTSTITDIHCNDNSRRDTQL
ncbi:hypothetical protein K443DRAFT_193644 [Laccaria amethystina LaAM-08-1]|uniref:Uncharacterized protein n=1 Tax=Laccaria amethystina LaAM-08-1 TaxID=1095629 RepID=A0A0C9XBG1_9AGAR|nr:hypothetical protein K443DRAFT_193644 [Laccaria amethystina LaAM-08-1]